MDGMSRVSVNGNIYLIHAISQAFGEPYPSAQTIYHLKRIPDNFDIGTLIFLGTSFGYRLILKGFHGEPIVSEYTEDKVTFS